MARGRRVVPRMGVAAAGSASAYSESLLEVVRRLGLLPNLRLCLDAGAADSYVAGQRWLDMSGYGSDFFVGADGSVTASDPAFNGSAGALSGAEFWSFDAGDYFRHAAINASWMESIHQDNARFTLLSWAYLVAASLNNLAGTSNGVTTNVGFNWGVNTSNGNGYCNICNGSGSYAKQLGGSGAGFTSGAWQQVAVSVNEAGTYFWQRNATPIAAATASYTSPSAAGATYTFEVGSGGNGSAPIPSGARIALFAAFDTNLTQGQLEQIYGGVRGRFGV